MIKKNVLSNGVRLVTEEMPYVNSVAIGFWIKAGSRYEVESLHGITHFIEHMLFKGTSARSAKRIAEELEAVGGSLNAFTSREHTCVYARVLKEDLDLAVDLLADMVLNSTFDECEIEKEKNIICEEIMMYEDTPDEIIHDLFTQRAWYGHPLGRSILGTKETVSAISRNDVLRYYQSHFTAANIVITAAGNLSHLALKEKLEECLAEIPRIKTELHFQKNPIFVPSKYYKIKDTEQMHMCLGTEGLPQDSEKLYPLMVFNNLLGGGISSRLFQSVREDMGLAYSIYSYVSVYSDQGLLVVYAGTSLKNAAKIIEEIKKQINSLINKDISQIELDRTKNQLRGSILLNMENVSHRMSRLGRTEISYDRVITAEEATEKIMKVTLDDLHALSSLLADFNKYSIVTIGAEKLPGFETCILEGENVY
ncbi:MAG: pitrilysin family protein [Bacillota bacterium]